MKRKNWMVKAKSGKLHQHRKRRDADGNLTLSALKKDVWTIFSRYIRTKECLESTGSVMSGKCITCGNVYPFQKLQAGHLIDGRMNAILFEENGVHIQCHGCNMFKGGAKVEYITWMKNKYGETEIERLRALSHTTRVFTREHLLALQQSLLFQLESLNREDPLVLEYRKKGLI